MIINGDKTPQSNREEVRFGLQGGEYSKRITGPVDEVRKLIPALVAAGATGVFIHDSSPIATLEYTFGSIDMVTGNPADERPTSVYECQTAEVEKDILESDIAVTNGVNGTASETLLRKYLNGTDLTPAEVASLSANGTAVYGEIKAGFRSIRIMVPTLKISKVVSNAYTVKAAQTNVNRLIATAKVSTDESIPVGILFDLPANTTTKPNRSYAWLKKPPQVTITGGNRFAVSQEYEFGLWSTVIYGAVVS